MGIDIIKTSAKISQRELFEIYGGEAKVGQKTIHRYLRDELSLPD